MFDLILYAIPFFTVTLFLEMASFFLPDDDERGLRTTTAQRVSRWGVGNVAVNAGWKLGAVRLAYVYELSPASLRLRRQSVDLGGIGGSSPTTSSTHHRTHHTIRIFWASHVVHHPASTSLSTALRQP